MIIIVNYRLSFADQGKQTSVCRFRQEQTNGKCRFQFFPFFVCVGMCVFMVCIYLYVYIFIFTFKFLCWRFKRKTENESPGNFPYSVYRLLIKLVFFRSLSKKQMEVICLQSTTVNGLDGLAHLWLLLTWQCTLQFFPSSRKLFLYNIFHCRKLLFQLSFMYTA
jgi:hypothetical protein